ncbi:MAG: hypothetical protein M3P11_13585 [Actinomycetota bacterium]|nr:hypothetical protein [Actinomycetota bacterium]
MERARQAGWWFEHAPRSHSFGRLRCVPPENDPDGQACTLMVLSTPSGPADGSDTEKWILGALRKCPHGVPPALSHSTPEGAATIAAGELSRIEGLLEAAAGLLAEGAQRAESERLLEEALRVLDDDPTAADELDRRSRELEDASRASAARGLAGTARAGLDPRWPPEEAARDLLAAADEKLTAVTALLADLQPSDQEAYQAAVDRAAARIERLRTELG